MSVALSPLTPADADACAWLETVLFPGDGPWTADAFRSELAAPHNHYVAARENGVLVGYAGIALLGRGDATESEVHTIGVDPSAHRRGIGGALLNDLLAAADQHGGPVFLEVRTDNVAAIELYGREGFVVMGTRRNYYQPSGADAYTMRRPSAGSEGEPS
ncbi:ribosomal protein S18-alanine N-acetyltransferase [Rhodococcoides kyotonense]|uniref:Ribosomal-protein-alanine N-acetyltransferase n=1 Tax=Rhodococcoides kyotonense TaxID=398843 RepID=A0A239MQB2_9NOCA|nr:ribosomal protein S18-alanine N-acetyltransferase [Rhodococcus kyotonensis]SNT44304.1 ribosomal-protein-alanine N-acetyltransferase [Rhodococcus kyotonensis]